MLQQKCVAAKAKKSATEVLEKTAPKEETKEADGKIAPNLMDTVALTVALTEMNRIRKVQTMACAKNTS